MMTYQMNKEDYQLIVQFFERTLEENKLPLFEKRLKEDANFARQVELYEYANGEVTTLYYPNQAAEIAAFKAQLNELKEKNQWVTQRKIAWSLFGIAATIAFLLFASTFFFNETPIDFLALAENKALQVNTNSLANQSNRAILTLEDNRHQQQLIAAFEAKDYQKIITLGNQMKDSKIESVQLLKGLAYRKLNQIEKAIPCLNQVVVQRDIALWNLAAIYLTQEPIDENKARFYLNQLIQEDFNSKTTAKVILKALDKD